MERGVQEPSANGNETGAIISRTGYPPPASAEEQETFWREVEATEVSPTIDADWRKALNDWLS